jgi:hypothetical protein
MHRFFSPIFAAGLAVTPAVAQDSSTPDVEPYATNYACVYDTEPDNDIFPGKTVQIKAGFTFKPYVQLGRAAKPGAIIYSNVLFSFRENGEQTGLLILSNAGYPETAGVVTDTDIAQAKSGLQQIQNLCKDDAGNDRALIEIERAFVLQSKRPPGTVDPWSRRFKADKAIHN